MIPRKGAKKLQKVPSLGTCFIQSPQGGNTKQHQKR